MLSAFLCFMLVILPLKMAQTYCNAVLCPKAQKGCDVPYENDVFSR